MFRGEKEKALLRLMILMMTSDRRIHSRETSLIREIYGHLTGGELTDAEFKKQIALVDQEDWDFHKYLREIAPQFDEGEKELLLKAIFLVGVADGVFRDPEEEMMLESAIALGVSTERLREIVENILAEGRQ